MTAEQIEESGKRITQLLEEKEKLTNQLQNTARQLVRAEKSHWNAMNDLSDVCLELSREMGEAKQKDLPF